MAKGFNFPSHRLIKSCALITLLVAPLLAYAAITEEEMEANCLKVDKYAAEGGRYYGLKQYPKARNQYELQVGWSESCQLGEDKIAMAYNNVALTYVHEGVFLRARAWLNILPNDKRSIFNLNKINHNIKIAIEELPSKPSGHYWKYSGVALWNNMTIKPHGQNYKIDFFGYYAGLMAMYGGPNFGEFSTVLDFKNGKAHYAMNDNESDCKYDFNIEEERLTVTRVAGESCGFGHNVGAEGVYYRVES
jgi:hypothetical protein